MRKNNGEKKFEIENFLINFATTKNKTKFNNYKFFFSSDKQTKKQKSNRIEQLQKKIYSIKLLFADHQSIYQIHFFLKSGNSSIGGNRCPFHGVVRRVFLNV